MKLRHYKLPKYPVTSVVVIKLQMKCKHKTFFCDVPEKFLPSNWCDFFYTRCFYAVTSYWNIVFRWRRRWICFSFYFVLIQRDRQRKYEKMRERMTKRREKEEE